MKSAFPKVAITLGTGIAPRDRTYVRILKLALRISLRHSRSLTLWGTPRHNVLERDSSNVATLQPHRNTGLLRGNPRTACAHAATPDVMISAYRIRYGHKTRCMTCAERADMELFELPLSAAVYTVNDCFSRYGTHGQPPNANSHQKSKRHFLGPWHSSLGSRHFRAPSDQLRCGRPSVPVSDPCSPPRLKVPRCLKV